MLCGLKTQGVLLNKKTYRPRPNLLCPAQVVLIVMAPDIKKKTASITGVSKQL